MGKFTFFDTNWTDAGPPSIAFAHSNLVADKSIARIALVDQLAAEIVVRVVSHIAILEITYFGASGGFNQNDTLLIKEL